MKKVLRGSETDVDESAVERTLLDWCRTTTDG